MLPVSGYDFIGKGYMYSYRVNKYRRYKTYKVPYKGEEKIIQIGNDGENITLQIGNEKAIFNYKDFIRSLRKKGIYTKTATNNNNFIVVFDSQNKRFKVKINIESISGKITVDNKIMVNNLRYLFLLKLN